MGDLELFLSAYEESGGSLAEGKTTADTKTIVKMLANFAPNDLPEKVKKPELVASPKPQPGTDAKAAGPSAGETAAKDALANPGTIAYQYVGGRANKPVDMVAYRSSGWNPFSGAVRFTKAEYDAMIAEYEAQKDVLAADKPDGGDDADTGDLEPAPLDMEAPAVDQEAAKPWLEEMAASGLAQQKAVLETLGMKGPEVDKWVKNNQRQMRGLGHRTLLFKAAAEAFGYRNATPQQIEQAANELTDAQNRAMGLAYQLKNNMITCETIPEDDRDFLMNCIRLRGTGKSQGVYMKGGNDCGGELGAIGGEQLTSGGDVYGLKMGTQTSFVYKQLDGLDKMKCEVDGKSKSLVPRGRLESAAANQFNAINGDMNEYYAELAHILFVQKDRRKFKKVYRQMVEDLGNKHNVSLFLKVAASKAAGDIDQLEVASLAEEGSIELIDDITEEFGETPDEKKALAWLIARNLSNWKTVVTNLPPGFEYTKVGTEGAGIIVNPEGEPVIVNADIEAQCPKGDAQGVYANLAVNKKYDMAGARQGENPACFRASVKDDAHGNWIDAGKRSLLKLWGLENEAVNTVRDKQADFIEHVAKADGVDLPDDWRTQAETYRRNEVEFVNNTLELIARIPKGALGDVAKMKKAEVPYEELQRYEAFYDRMEAYNKEKDPKKKHRLKAELTTALAQGYRAKHSKDPAMRYNMAIEAAVTGMSTEREAFILTGSKGTYMGLESDVAGGAVAQIIGGAPMKFTSTRTKFMSEDGKTDICSISLRRKDATSSQFLVINKDWARTQLRPVEEEEDVTESVLHAEDFVRQLKELIQRIDKVRVV